MFFLLNRGKKSREEVGSRVVKLPSPVTVSPCHKLPRCSVRTNRLLSLFSLLSTLAASATRQNKRTRPHTDSNSRLTINNGSSSQEGGNECAGHYRCFPSLYQKSHVCLFPRHSETRTLVGGEKEQEKRFKCSGGAS